MNSFFILIRNLRQVREAREKIFVFFKRYSFSHVLNTREDRDTMFKRTSLNHNDILS